MRFLRPAVIIGALPVTLTNGTTADATQVMSDLNWIVNQVNANAAALATTAVTNANNNFTAVQSGVAASAPANFPIASQIQGSVFQTFQSTLGTNSLTARQAALALTAWPTDGVFTFVPSQTNTGPANITVDSAGSSIMFSMGSTLVGGELRAGIPAQVERDATKLNLLTPANVRFDLASSTGGGGIRMLVQGTPAPIAIGKQPFRTVYTATGFQTHTCQTGCMRLISRLVGAGGGGSGSGAAVVNGSAGGNTVFGPLTAGGGQAGTGAGGAGGTNSGSNQISLAGGSGGGSSSRQISGDGGVSFFGGGGGGSGVSGGGYNAGANTGSGGGGGSNADGSQTGAGGGAGGFIEHQFIFPPAAFSIGVGTGGAGGIGTVSTGGTGGNGLIIVDEFFN